MERKTAVVELKDLDERGEGLAVIATLNQVDRDGDVVLPGALSGQVAPLVAAHEWSEAPLGKARVREEGNEVLAAFSLNMGLSRAREWRQAVQFDLAHPPAQIQYSWGFSIPEGGASVGEFAGKRVRFLKNVKLHEISFVLLGSSVGTRTLALKADQDEAALVASAVAEYHRMRERGVALDGLIALALPFPGEVGYTILNHADANHMYDRPVAVALVKEACDELKIPMAAAVELFREARPGETPDFYSEKGIGGCAFVAERKIYLRYDLRGRRLAELAGHEAHHLSHRGSSEQEAERFGSAFARKALGDSPRPGKGFTMEQLGAIAQVIKSGLPIPR